MRRRPYSVILLDEVEKAHPEVFNILLQVLDDGRLTDGQGRTVDFRNCILIMTSNLGSEFLVQQERDQSEREAAVMEVVRNYFRPEFINRLDDVVMFSPLGTEELTHIVDLQLGALQKRLEDRRLTLDVTAAAKDWLVLHGFDPIYGRGRCDVLCRPRSAMRWRRRFCPARSSTDRRSRLMSRSPATSCRHPA